MPTIGDKLFTASTNWIQGHVFHRLISKARIERRQRTQASQSDEWRDRLLDLGIPLEELSWGPMTLLPRRVTCLIDAIEAQPPTAVLEIGSGGSTIVLAALAARYGFTVVSIENFRGSYDWVRTILAKTPGGTRVQMVLAGFVRKHYSDGKSYRWYDVNLDNFGLRFDFVLIDGPSSKLVGRNGGLPEIRPYLALKHRIYVDDAFGKHGQVCLDQWQHYFPELVIERLVECGRMGRLSFPETPS